MKQQALMVFAKAPVPGLAKTRLIPQLGEQGAAQLQQELLQRVIARCAQSQEWDTHLWCAPHTGHPLFQTLSREYGLTLHCQSEGDLGQKMSQAFERTLVDYQRVLIIGTDCPAMDAAIIRQGFAALQGGNEVVITPAEDGGYVLVGLNAAEQRLFEGIEWGSSRVFDQTARRLEQLQLSTMVLPTLWDLDEIADYRRYASLLEAESGLGNGVAEAAT